MSTTVEERNLLQLRDCLDLSITDVKTLVVLMGFYIDGSKNEILEHSLHMLSEKIEEARRNAEQLCNALAA